MTQGRPIFHEQTHEDLNHLADHMPHALGLYGEQGIGLLTAAQALASLASAQVLTIYPEKNDKVDLEYGSITIDIVRRLYQLTQGKSKELRCIIIVAADTMSQAAQNAFLKLLEEPTNNTSFILLVYRPNELLSTVRSRLQIQIIRPITTEQSGLLLDRLGVDDEPRRKQLLFIAKGLPARLTNLATDEGRFEAEASLLRQSHALIQGSLYERLRIIDAVKGSRQRAVGLIDYAMTLVQRDILTKQRADSETVRLLGRFETAREQLDRNGNVRLVLTRAVVR